MKQIKFLVFGLRNLLIKADADSSTGKGDFDSTLVHEFGRLIAYARAQGIEPVVFANHGWTMHGGEQVEDLLARKWGAMRWITADGRRFPFKPQAGAMDAVLNPPALQWPAHEKPRRSGVGFLPSLQLLRRVVIAVRG